MDGWDGCLGFDRDVCVGGARALSARTLLPASATASCIACSVEAMVLMLRGRDALRKCAMPDD
jgi:hypothetical protein